MSTDQTRHESARKRAEYTRDRAIQERDRAITERDALAEAVGTFIAGWPNFYHGLKEVRAALALVDSVKSAPAAGVSRLGGLCDTTSTYRNPVQECFCRTYPENLGPCKTWERGGNARCVYCDHDLSCHEKVAGIPTTPGTEPK